MSFFHPCNWCGEEVALDINNMPMSGQWKEYVEGWMVVYCSVDCAMREYDFMFKEYPESVCDPIPAKFQDSLRNH